MSRALSWRALMVVAVVAASVWVSTTQPVRLGLDLRGGTQIVLEGRDTAEVEVTDEVADRIIEVMRRRVDGLGVAESSLQKSGDRRVIVELPGVDDPDEAVAVIGRTAQLTFHPVTGIDTATPPEGAPAAPDAPTADGTRTLPDETGQLLVLGPAALTGAGVSDAKAQLGETGAWSTVVELTDGQAWSALTGEAACAPNGAPQRRVAIVLDDSVVSSPQVGVGVPCGTGITGGSTEITGNFTDEEARADLDAIRDDLAAVGFSSAIVQESGSGNVSVRTRQLDATEEAVVDEIVGRQAGAGERLRDEFVGPTIGDELRNKAIIAVGLALSAQLLYLAVRFRWTFATSAVVAMAYDAIIVVGVFAWLGKEVDGVFIAAVLTVVGYSVNDSVVIFDRIRERVAQLRSRPFARVANDAAMETMPRTINTGLSSLFVLVALLLLGGDTLANFSLALIVGILVGTYSSVVVATPLAVVLEQRWGDARRDVADDRAGEPVRAPVGAGVGGRGSTSTATAVALDPSDPGPTSAGSNAVTPDGPPDAPSPEATVENEPDDPDAPDAPEPEPSTEPRAYRTPTGPIPLRPRTAKGGGRAGKGRPRR